MVTPNQKSFLAKENTVERKYYIVDAKDKILGRLAAKVASVLRGKHKAIFTPHVDTGDYVIVINASQIKVTGNKLEDKVYHRFTGYPSGQRSVKLGDMLNNKPAQVIKLAVDRMIPKGPLGYKQRTKLKVYAGDKHPHAAQKPIPLAV